MGRWQNSREKTDLPWRVRAGHTDENQPAANVAEQQGRGDTKRRLPLQGLNHMQKSKKSTACQDASTRFQRQQQARETLTRPSLPEPFPLSRSSNLVHDTSATHSRHVIPEAKPSKERMEASSSVLEAYTKGGSPCRTRYTRRDLLRLASCPKDGAFLRPRFDYPETSPWRGTELEIDSWTQRKIQAHSKEPETARGACKKLPPPRTQTRPSQQGPEQAQSIPSEPNPTSGKLPPQHLSIGEIPQNPLPALHQPLNAKSHQLVQNLHGHAILLLPVAVPLPPQDTQSVPPNSHAFHQDPRQRVMQIPPMPMPRHPWQAPQLGKADVYRALIPPKGGLLPAMYMSDLASRPGTQMPFNITSPSVRATEHLFR